MLFIYRVMTEIQIPFSGQNMDYPEKGIKKDFNFSKSQRCHVMIVLHKKSENFQTQMDFFFSS